MSHSHNKRKKKRRKSKPKRGHQGWVAGAVQAKATRMAVKQYREPVAEG